MTLDPVILSRLQFFWVVSFHILFPAFTVGLACYIAVLEGLYLKTKDRTYFLISVFWTKIFAISFGLGCRHGNCHALSVRYELEPLLRYRLECHRPTDGLRRPH